MNNNELVIQLQQVTKRFAGQTVLAGVSATVREGEVIGLLAENGAGKTTLLELLLGFLTADSGDILLWQQPVANLPLPLKHRIGYVPQRDELIESLSGRKNLELLASFYVHWDWSLVDRLAIDWLLPLDSRVSSLSLGQRQKLAILAALASKPQLLILDEPVASLDPLARRQFLKTLAELADSECTIIFSTHIVSDLERIASRLWLLKGQHIALDLAPEQLLEQVRLVTGEQWREQSRGLVKVLNSTKQFGQNHYLLFGEQLDFGLRLSLENLFVELYRQ